VLTNLAVWQVPLLAGGSIRGMGAAPFRIKGLRIPGGRGFAIQRQAQILHTAWFGPGPGVFFFFFLAGGRQPHEQIWPFGRESDLTARLARLCPEESTPERHR